jgi:hypothetical protein
LFRVSAAEEFEEFGTRCLVARFEVFGMVEAMYCIADEWVQIGKAELSMLDGIEDPKLTINSFFSVNVDECSCY